MGTSECNSKSSFDAVKKNNNVLTSTFIQNKERFDSYGSKSISKNKHGEIFHNICPSNKHIIHKDLETTLDKTIQASKVITKTGTPSISEWTHENLLESNISNQVSLSVLKHAKFPSKAGPGEQIKLPRQRQVDKDEYKEFLRLGLGGIFDLDLSLVIEKDKKWLDPMSDNTDFFNYGHSLESWQIFCQRVKSYRANIQHSLPVESYNKNNFSNEKEFFKGRFAGTWNYQIWITSPIENILNRKFDSKVYLIFLEGRNCKDKYKWLRQQDIRNFYGLLSTRKSRDLADPKMKSRANRKFK